MRATLHGHVSGPAVAVIGVWDPMLPAHTTLFEELRCYARERGLTALAVAIDPDPVRYLSGESELPVYDDAATRIRRILACGIDAVLRVRFCERDIDRGAADLLRVADPFIRIAELWLGARQTLGRMEAGNFATVDRLAAERQMRVLRLPERRLETRDVRRLLQSGRLAEAAGLVGRPPVWSRPRSGRLRLAWCPGPYRAFPIDDPAGGMVGSPLDVELIPDPTGVHSLPWPARRAKYLAFVLGPHDLSGGGDVTGERSGVHPAPL